MTKKEKGKITVDITPTLKKEFDLLVYLKKSTQTKLAREIFKKYLDEEKQKNEKFVEIKKIMTN